MRVRGGAELNVDVEGSGRRSRNCERKGDEKRKCNGGAHSSQLRFDGSVIQRL